ncbi:hypothetical protein HYH03_006287 [Edaphochlamys debaryana]|uniref:Sulfhydryl oxidase n=1 Tax=Edaphochlamys debaryana TaxID=47281 RepID=A0A836C1A2_9CHLO|nr:hypothetical protein HYH03_006287 [Edaphochlamys debaryana]|eukprot:KAG2495687.1 hypothetical protein HYH03_006287 [Edaphochlamys debaryana]
MRTSSPAASLPLANITSTGLGLSSPPLASTTALAPAYPAPAASAKATAAATAKAEVGRATWTLLHTLAAQFPQKPSRQQQKDARTLVDVLTRIYPCGDCARHFAELVKREPPVVTSGPEFRRWLCSVHNRVNSRLGKPTFNCDLVESRWSPLGCSPEEDDAGELGAAAGCDLLGVGAKGPRRR